MIKWLARTILSLLALAIVGAWLYGNYAFFILGDRRDGVTVVVAIDVLLIIPGLFLSLFALGWLWGKAELEPKPRNTEQD